MEWQQVLREKLLPDSKIAVLGAGSILCGDDAAGMLLIEELQARCMPENVLLLAGSTAPENFTGLIKDFSPDLLILVDAAYIGREIGDIGIIESCDIKSAGFSTHMLPLNVMLEYLETTAGIESLVLGMQPGNVDFATEPSAAMQKSIQNLANFISQLVNNQ